MNQLKFISSNIFVRELVFSLFGLVLKRKEKKKRVCKIKKDCKIQA